MKTSDVTQSKETDMPVAAATSATFMLTAAFVWTGVRRMTKVRERVCKGRKRSMISTGDKDKRIL